MNKKFILNAVFFLISILCPILAIAQQTSVYLTNNTANELEITFNLTHQFIKPFATNAILQITRDGQMPEAQVDKFIVQINHPHYLNQTILYTLERKGTFLSSHIKNFLKLPNQNEIEFLKKNNFIEKQDKFWGNNFHLYAREWLSIGHIYDDIHLVIDETPNRFQRSDNSNELTMLNYNVQMMPFYTGVVDNLNYANRRVKLIPARIKNYDVVVVEELFDRSLRNIFTNLMSSEYPFHTEVVGENSSDLLSGGEMIFSHWPIIKFNSKIYNNCHGTDCLAAKGVSYAEINKLGKVYHLFGTHLQADDNLESQKIRLDQLATLQQFIVGQNINENEPILLLGDMNIDLNNEEYNHLQKTIPFLLPQNFGYPYSYDGFVNAMAITKAAQRLDYILPIKNHQFPVMGKSNIFPLRALENESMWPNFELSDHFPIEAIFKY